MTGSGVEHYKVSCLFASQSDYFYSVVLTETGAANYSKGCVKALGMPSGNNSLPAAWNNLPHTVACPLVCLNSLLPVEI